MHLMQCVQAVRIASAVAGRFQASFAGAHKEVCTKALHWLKGGLKSVPGADEPPNMFDARRHAFKASLTAGMVSAIIIQCAP